MRKRRWKPNPFKIAVLLGLIIAWAALCMIAGAACGMVMMATGAV